VLTLKIRKCECYESELKACRAPTARLHQYYVHGESQDCEQWKLNLEDCKKWRDNEDEEAVKRIIGREDVRLAWRWKGHLANDVWEKRKEPPQDWNRPLPEHLADAAEESFLRIYRERMEKGEELMTKEDRMNYYRCKLNSSMPACSIM